MREEERKNREIEKRPETARVFPRLEVTSGNHNFLLLHFSLLFMYIDIKRFPRKSNY